MRKRAVRILPLTLIAGVFYFAYLMYEVDPTLEYRAQSWPGSPTPGQRAQLVKTLLARARSPLPIPDVIRNHSIEMIGRLRDPSAIEPLTKLLRNDSLKCAALEALGSIGDSQTLPLLKEIAGKNEKWSWCAKRALTFYRQSELAPLYFEFLRYDDHNPNNQSDETVRESAAQALGAVPAQESVEALFTALKDPSLRVVGAAGRSLSEINAPGTLERIREEAVELTDRFKTNENAALFAPPAEALEAIEKQKDEETKKLIEMLLDGSIVPSRRREAAEELSVAGVKEAIPILIEYTKRDHLYDQRTGYFGLARFRDPSLRAIFEQGERSGDFYIRQVSVQTRRHHLGLTEDEEAQAVEEMIRAAAHPERHPKDPMLHLSAERQLKMSKPVHWKKMIEALTHSQEEKDSAAVKRLFSYLENHSTEASSEFFWSLPVEEIKKLVPFLSHAEERIWKTSFELLTFRFQESVLDSIHDAFVQEKEERIKKRLGLMLTAVVWSREEAKHLRAKYAGAIFYLIQFPDLLNDRELQKAAQTLGHPAVSSLFAGQDPAIQQELLRLARPEAPSIGELIRLTGSPSTELRFVAEQMLEGFDREKVMREAIGILMSRQSQDRFLAARALIRIGPTVIPELERVYPAADFYGRQFIDMVFEGLRAEPAHPISPLEIEKEKDSAK